MVGLPLFLPSLILPIFAHINTFAHISSGEVFLFYLPLALMISMMMFFAGRHCQDHLRDFCPQICRAGFLRNALING